MRTIKRALGPKNIMNPGKIFTLLREFCTAEQAPPAIHTWRLTFNARRYIFRP
jgi:FAD linked oxidases, C-terminal domain